jgi:hypothetical protein
MTGTSRWLSLQFCVLDAAHLKADLEVLASLAARPESATNTFGWHSSDETGRVASHSRMDSRLDHRFVVGGTSADALRARSRRAVSPSLAVDASGRLG